MTTPPHAFHLTVAGTEQSVRVEVTGDLDYDSADLLLEKVTAELSARPALEDLYVDCAGIGFVDSMGLSILLMVGRRATAARVRLHLVDRPAQLDRVLDITGTLEYFTATPLADDAVTHRDTADPSTITRTAEASRPTGPDTTVSSRP
ncbi:STAS domain-containing protein [Streptomyces aquilus]|uniref:STAS domain-containing protein n=1 Tax=Streptomyces aquilus TaxID=2548456 RepID=UPI00367E486E